jgi:hypothetical protein
MSSHMANRSTYPLVDMLFDGRLAERLRVWRVDEARSFEDIAYLIRAESGIQRSAKTVQRWYEDEVAA